MKKIFLYSTVFMLSTLISCTLYTDNENVLNIDEEIEETEEFERLNTLIRSKNPSFTLANSNNLNESTFKLENETKKIKEEISTLLETF